MKKTLQQKIEKFLLDKKYGSKTIIVNGNKLEINFIFVPPVIKGTSNSYYFIKYISSKPTDDLTYKSIINLQKQSNRSGISFTNWCGLRYNENITSLEIIKDFFPEEYRNCILKELGI